MLWIHSQDNLLTQLVTEQAQSSASAGNMRDERQVPLCRRYTT